MSKYSASKINRRQWIRQASCAAVGTIAMRSALRDFRLMNAAMAQGNVANDYKALVCIFLSGGNDSNNLIIPTITSEYNNYAAIRTNVLAIPQTAALGISPINFDGHDYGFHPACGDITGQKGIKQLFDQGRLGVLFNTGVLSHPLTRVTYNSSASLRPPQLFSHADQVTQWQTSIPDQPPLTGWGGRTADLLAAALPSAPISLTVTLAGANTFEVGSSVSQYSVSTGGAISLTLPGSPASRLQTLTNIFNVPYSNLQAKAYGGVANHAVNTGATLNSAILPTVDPFWTTTFPGLGTSQFTNPIDNSKHNSGLGPQLKMIARLIEAGSRPGSPLAMKRQIFFCTIGGFDTHTGQTNVPTPINPATDVLTGSHSNLFAELSQCMWAFQQAMDQIGAMASHNDPNFANRVTAFTCSDFGRTFPANGLGSDHGWGSHHLVMGGAVRGQRTYGKFPTLAVNGPDDTNTGRWIPSTACDQYFATLASWFGLDNNNLTTVFPNITRFASSNLGFV